MRYDTIADVFAANKAARERFLETIAEVSDIEAQMRPVGEKWSISQVAEHLAMVDRGISRICKKLLGEAQDAGIMSEGRTSISPQFWLRSVEIAEEKLEAPPQVEPTGGVSISESVEKLRNNAKMFEEMRHDLEMYDSTLPTFPHPYFGAINAVEWLILAGGHEHRHTMQIKRLLTLIRQEKSPG